MQPSASLIDHVRNVWTFERATGDTFSCALEPTANGWMAWFSVNGQRVGGHRFEEKAAAVRWADDLLSAFREVELSSLGRTNRHACPL